MGEDEEGFLSAQADTFAGANVKEKASACFVRNDGGVLETRLREDVAEKASACSVRNDGWAGWELESFGEEGLGVEVLLFQVRVEDHG